MSLDVAMQKNVMVSEPVHEENDNSVTEVFAPIAGEESVSDIEPQG